jgi:predicted transcriptional regulator
MPMIPRNDRHAIGVSVWIQDHNGDSLVDHIISLTAQIVSAHVANNGVAVQQLPAFIRGVYQTLATVGQAPVKTIKPKAAVDAKKSVFADHILCLACGGSFKMLKRHIATDHQMTPVEYRIKWGLSHDYPMVSAEHAAQRSQLAKDNGLGRKKTEAPPPPSKKGGRPKKG